MATILPEEAGAVDTIPAKVLQNGDSMPGRPAYFVKEGGQWQATSWRHYAGEVKTAGKALMALGVGVGDPIGILGFNRAEWVISDVAAMAVGAVPAGIYTTNSAEECQYIINHSEAPIVVLEDESQWHKIAQVRDELPKLRHVVMMKGSPQIDDPMVLSWDEFMAKGDEVSDEDFHARLNGLEMDQLATLIYTSGTTGPPKGVMLSHENMAWTAAQISPVFQIGPDDRVLSYLPLSHIAEQSFTIASAALNGHCVYYAESIEKLADNVKEVQPTIFFGVPRVWERFYAGVREELGKSTGLKAKIADWAQSVGRRVSALRNRGLEPSGALLAQYKTADALVFSKVKKALGFSEARVLASGAAPVSPEILEFFSGLDLIIYEVYGQSEDSGPTSFNVPGRTKFGSVGPPYPNVEVEIAEDGEILVRGDNVFMGYYKDEEATNETLVDGWLHSGDLGEFDADGMLWITGRKKDIIITAGGKNVAPKPLEAGLKNHPLVGEAVVIGDRRKFLSAVVTIDEEQYAKFKEKAGESAAPHESETLRKEIQSCVDELNARFARVEQIKKFAILPRPLSIEGGELTPTLKVKRNKVAEHFADVIDAMYA